MLNLNKGPRLFINACMLLLIMVTLSACDKVESPKPARPELKIGRLICGGHLPLAIFEKRFQAEARTFQLVAVQNHDWNDVADDMRSGALAGTFILSPLAIKLIHDGFPGKIVMAADRNGNGFVLSKSIKSIAMLAQKQVLIAVPHKYSQHHVLLYLLLKQHGIDPGHVRVLGMPPRDMINAMKNGEIDGFVVGEPEAYKAVSQDVGWLAAISPAIWKDHMDHVLLVTDRFINQHPDQLQELIDFLVRSDQFIEANPHEAAVMGEDYTGSNAAVFEQVLTDPPDWISFDNSLISEKDLQTMMGYMVEMGLLPSVPAKPARTYTDMRFVRQALSEAN